jgi:hypothetical protein
MVQFFAPENEQEIKRRRVMAELLRSQAKQPEQTQVVSGYAVPQSPLQGLAGAISQVAGAYQDKQAGDIETKDANQRAAFLKDAITKSGGNSELLAESLMGQPSTMDAGLGLYTQNIKTKADAAQWERDAGLKRELAAMRRGGGSYVDPETGEIVQPERKLSSTEQKEIFDTMDLNSSGEGAKSALLKAKAIMDNPAGSEPYTGFGADTRAWAARLPLIGDIVADKERGAATTEYSTLINEQALVGLKGIFGGNPTEGERNILMKMQALSTYTPEEQKAIINNAIEAADRRQKFNQGKIRGIQTGSYKTDAPPPEAPPEAPRQAPDGKYYIPDPNRPGKYLMVEP